MAIILVVEDEKEIREEIAELLQKEQHKVLQAATGQEAIDKVSREGSSINVVLLDIILPDINGVEVLKKIKADYIHLNVIMVTVFKTVATAVKCFQEGAYDYITKPFIPEDLLAAIKRALEKEKVEKEFYYCSERMEKSRLDFERRRILFQELAMQSKLEGREIPPEEYIKIMQPPFEKRLESKPWEEWTNELQSKIKTELPAEQPSGANILVIEDEKDIRDEVMEILKKDYKPTGANSAAEALSKLEKDKFDVVLLDIVLPDRSGIDILPEIIKASPKSRVIMLTVMKNVKTAVSAMKLGAYDYLTKPFIVEELLAVINQAVSLEATKDHIRRMIKQMEKERLSESFRKELFQRLIEKRKTERENISMNDIFAFFPELRGEWAPVDWRQPVKAIEEIGVDEMLKRFKEQKKRWEDVLRAEYGL